MIELVTPEDPDADVQQIPIFSRDGVVYTIPDRVRPNLMLSYLHKSRTIGIGRAESWLAEEMLGTEAYEALITFDALTQEQSDEIFSHAREIILGEQRPKEPDRKNGSTKQSAKKSVTRKR